MTYSTLRRPEGKGGALFLPLRLTLLLAAGALASVSACATTGARAPAAAPATPSIAADTTWAGDVVVRESVVVTPNALLRVLPGTTVHIAAGKGIAITVLGRLRVEGTATSPVVFAPDVSEAGRVAWDGIRIGPGAGEQSLAGFRIEGARDGISVTGTAARLRNGAFAGCGTGVRVNRMAQAAVDNCVFRVDDAGGVVATGGRASFAGCRFDGAANAGVVAEKGGAIRVSGCAFSGAKTGILSLTDAPFRIEQSRFRSLETGIVARQAVKTSAVSRCAFENNGTGILAVQFCAIEVADSLFRGNGTAVDVRESSTPLVLHNRFEANGAAINLSRKAHARLEKNVFVRNRNGVVVNYSSYPRIVGNNFDRNDMAVRHEKYPSGEWEERAGPRALAAGEAAGRGSRAMPAGAAPQRFSRRVDAKGNFWGAGPAQGPAAAALAATWDGRKYGPVRYEGSGDDQFAIDVVDFSPAETAPVRDAGPRAAARTGAGR